METQTKEKETIDHGLRESMGTLADANPTRLSKRSQAVLLHHGSEVSLSELWENMYKEQLVSGLPIRAVC